MTTLDVINPASGQRVARVPIDDPARIRAKARGARTAQPDWAAVPLRRRQEIIARFRQLIEEQTERLSILLTTEMGKPIRQSRNELKSLLERIDFFLAETPRTLRSETVWDDEATGTVERITREPLGVVANISAWNYPYFVGANVFLPALLTGNAVLYKPSEFVPQTGLAITELLHESGVPPEVFAAVIGPGEAGATLLRQGLDGVFFTGSHPTGQRIAKAIAGRSIKLQLELGGKDPAYVCDDVDAATAAESLADGAFYNTGQSCCSVERIYVHRSVWAPFLEAFTAIVKAFPAGDPRDEATYIGPVTRPAQLEVLEAQLADARHKGAKVHLRGRVPRGRGNYFAPTVLTAVSHDMQVMRAESFGPIIGLMKVDDDEQAVELMNDTHYGLTAGVYSRDRSRAEAILSRTNAGSVYWNCCDRVSPRLPWSGRNDSGVGLTLSREGILTFTRPKAWHLRRMNDGPPAV